MERSKQVNWSSNIGSFTSYDQISPWRIFCIYVKTSGILKVTFPKSSHSFARGADYSKTRFHKRARIVILNWVVWGGTVFYFHSRRTRDAESSGWARNNTQFLLRFEGADFESAYEPLVFRFLCFAASRLFENIPTAGQESYKQRNRLSTYSGFFVCKNSRSPARMIPDSFVVEELRKNETKEW